MEEARIKFEKDREKTLAELPESIKNMFGQIGFAPAEIDDSDDEDEQQEQASAVVPILIMDPFRVPPKPVRDVYWRDLLAKAKRAKKVDKLAYLVYHYGHDDPDDCYSFVEHDEFIPYEQGKTMGYDVLPEHLVGKTEQLTEREAIWVRSIAELNEDVVKEPHERTRGVDFLERHEQLKDPPASKKRKTTK